MRFDVIVVGAGPAGATAAIILGRAGVRVLLLDRARFPRHKLCGDTLNPGSVDLLARLGLMDSLRPIGRPLRGMRVTGEHGISVEARYPNGRTGLAIRRYELDAVLVEAAVRAGAQFEPAVFVRAPVAEAVGHNPCVGGVIMSRANDRPMRVLAPVTIAADGRHSTLAFQLGLARHPSRPRRWAVGGYFEAVGDLADVGEMHIRRGYYLGVAPLPNGIANVCLVTADRRGLAHPSARLSEAIRADALLASRFEPARCTAPVRMVGPLAVEAHAAGVRGLLLAGDASGFVDPMTGDGLHFALRGGELAAATALEMIEKGSAAGHEKLASARRREFLAKWRLNRSLRATVGSSIGLQAGSIVARLAPVVIEKLIIRAGDV